MTSCGSNITEDEEDIVLWESTHILYFAVYGVVMLVMCMAGVLGNLINLFVFWRRRHQAVTYFLFTVLAASDLAAVLLWVPELVRLGWYIGVEGMPQHATAVYYAHLSYPLINWTIVVSSLLVLAVSVERYVAVCYPLHVRRFGLSQQSTRLLLVISATFILPAAFYAPSVLEYSVVECEAGRYNKKWDADYNQSLGYVAYKWVRTICIRFVPILLIAALNLRTAVEFSAVLRRRELLRSSGSISRDPAESVERETTPSSTQIRHKRVRDERTRVVMLAGIGAQFVVCMLPVAIYHLLVDAGTRDDWSFRVFAAIADVLNITNSALNFYTYAAVSRGFRSNVSDFLNSHCRSTTNRVITVQQRQLPHRNNSVNDISTGQNTTYPHTGCKESVASAGAVSSVPIVNNSGK